MKGCSWTWAFISSLNFRTSTSFAPLPRLRVGVRRYLSSPRSVLVAPADNWAAAGVLSTCFVDNSRPLHFASLAAPWASSNVFFDSAGPALTAAVADSTGEYVACAQLIPAVLRREAKDALNPGVSSPPNVFFVQSVAVVPGSRRKGYGKKLMMWAEHEAKSQGASEMWLAVKEGEAAAVALHESCGYASVTSTPTFGNIIMRKSIQVISSLGQDRDKEQGVSFVNKEIEQFSPIVPVELDPSSLSAYAGTSASTLSRPRPSISAMGKELSGQSVVLFVACLGISAVVAPLGGRSLLDLFQGGVGPWAGAASGAFLGVATAAARVSLGGPEPGLVEACREDDGLRAQKSVLYRVTGAQGPTPSALAFLATWQIIVALSEELYYRGLLQSAGQSALTALVGLQSGPTSDASSLTVLCEVAPLVFSSVIFGVAHVEWAESGGESGHTSASAGSSFQWFFETFLWSLLYGTAFAASGHNLAFPVFTHAAQNIWWCLSDLKDMGDADPAILRELFCGDNEAGAEVNNLLS